MYISVCSNVIEKVYIKKENALARVKSVRELFSDVDADCKISLLMEHCLCYGSRGRIERMGLCVVARAGPFCEIALHSVS